MHTVRSFSVFFFYFLTAMIGTAAASEITSSSPVSDQEAACEKKDLQSCYFLADRYSIGRGISHNMDTAIGLWKAACDGGHGKSCFTLGGLYVAAMTFGSSTIKPPEDSVLIGLFDKSCELGEMDGCATMGMFYAKGAGVDKDISKAFSYLQKACDGGYAEACSGLGMMFIEGSTGLPEDGKSSMIPVDKEKGQVLLQKGCDLGETNACKYLEEN